MPRRRDGPKPQPFWEFWKAASVKGFSREAADYVWMNLEEEYRTPFREYCKTVRVCEGVERPSIEGEALVRLYIRERFVKTKKSLTGRQRALASVWEEMEHRHGDDFTVDDVIQAVQDTLNPHYWD